MKNSNTEYLNPFLNKVNLTISPINNINIVPKTNNPINVLLSIKQAGPSTLVKEKLIRHNPAATSE